MAALPALFALLAAAQDAPPQLTAEQIVGRMAQSEQSRLAALGAHTSLRRYTLENKWSNKRAEMVVRLKRASTGAKTYEVISESGSAFIRNRILKKIIEAEVEPGERSERDQGRILPANYNFRLIGTAANDGRTAYLLDLLPKTKTKFLIQGRVWVDTEDYAVARIEGSPAKNPSFWAKSVKIVHRNGKVGPFWLALSTTSRTEARIFGTTDVVIEYYDYLLEDQSGSTTAKAPQKGAHLPGSGQTK